MKAFVRLQCKSNSLEYLVLLDDLDGNCSVAEGPPGCARLRPQEHISHRWQDFITPSGFLRRLEFHKNFLRN